MKSEYLIFSVIFLTGIILPARGSATDLSGRLLLEATYFPTNALYEGQRDQALSMVIEPEYFHQGYGEFSFTFSPFARLDSADEDRSHLDIREMFFLYPAQSWELRIGLDKVFWGTTEFVHLVDIINQTDLIESIDQEEKLGQPMVRFSLIRDFGTFDFFALPYFRERTFPGTGGRLRNQLAVDTGHPIYESAAEEHHLDLAMRYTRVFGDLDMGLYYFKGTGREPELRLSSDSSGQIHLIPYYGQIEQTGLDLSLVTGSWLWKLEALYRSGMGDSFWATIGGFEISFPAVMDSNMDLGIIGEYIYDQRGEESPLVFQNDLMFGLRLALNDMASSELLLGISRDLDHRASFISLEAGRRLRDDIKLSLEAIFFVDQADHDISYSIRDDDHIRLGIAYYF